jgi:hypothetical protein
VLVQGVWAEGKGGFDFSISLVHVPIFCICYYSFLLCLHSFFFKCFLTVFNLSLISILTLTHLSLTLKQMPFAIVELG